MPPYGGRVNGRPFVLSAEGWPRARQSRSAHSRVGSLPSSEAETRGACRGSQRGALEGVRMGRTVYVGRGLGFFESFPLDWKEAVGLRGLCLRFKDDLVPWLGCP